MISYLFIYCTTPRTADLLQHLLVKGLVKCFLCLNALMIRTSSNRWLKGVICALLDAAVRRQGPAPAGRAGPVPGPGDAPSVLDEDSAFPNVPFAGTGAWRVDPLAPLSSLGRTQNYIGLHGRRQSAAPPRPSCSRTTFCRLSPSQPSSRLASTCRALGGDPRDDFPSNSRERSDTLMSCFADPVWPPSVTPSSRPRSLKKFHAAADVSRNLTWRYSAAEGALGARARRSASLSLLFATSTRLTCASAWSAICAIQLRTLLNVPRSVMS